MFPSPSTPAVFSGCGAARMVCPLSRAFLWMPTVPLSTAAAIRPLRRQTTGTSFINLTISNTSGYGIGLSENVTVNAGLSLSNGIVDAATDGKTLTANLSVSGGNDSSYVSGKLARLYATATSKAFPIGKGGFYRPV